MHKRTKTLQTLLSSTGSCREVNYDCDEKPILRRGEYWYTTKSTMKLFVPRAALIEHPLFATIAEFGNHLDPMPC